MTSRNAILVLALASVFSGSAMAAVSAEEAKQLGGPVLTEWGAERAGNKDGTIPAWVSERVKVPGNTLAEVLPNLRKKRDEVFVESES